MRELSKYYTSNNIEAQAILQHIGWKKLLELIT
jgi:hypothetical protein